MNRYALLPLPLLLALAGCGGGTSEEEPPAEAPSPTPAAAATDAALGQEAIPAALHGRWGLATADCDPGLADAQGLMTIGAQRLEFYESVGALDEVEQATQDSVRATFAFTGEGMEWEGDMLLQLEDGGDTLIRREYGEDAAPDPLRYTRC